MNKQANSSVGFGGVFLVCGFGFIFVAF